MIKFDSPLDHQMNKPDTLNMPYSSLEELLNSYSHGLGFVLAAIGLVMMLVKVSGELALLVCFVYGLSMMLMFLSSTLYHWERRPELKRKLKVMDHVAIYLLIAGTYTPFTVLAVGGMTGWIAVSLIWSFAVVGIAFKCFASKRFEKLSLITYLLMGWLAIFFIYPLYRSLTPEGFWLLIVGGLCYTFGAAFYAAKRLQFTHLVWHIFVIAGCSCHFLAIYLYVI